MRHQCSVVQDFKGELITLGHAEIGHWDFLFGIPNSYLCRLLHYTCTVCYLVCICISISISYTIILSILYCTVLYNTVYRSINSTVLYNELEYAYVRYSSIQQGSVLYAYITVIVQNPVSQAFSTNPLMTPQSSICICMHM
jgi:hypothetical protein